MNMTFQPSTAAAISPTSSTNRTFSEASDSYLQNGGSDRFLTPIVEYLGGRHMFEIFPFDIKQMSLALYPNHSAATRNRQAITPTRAVFFHAYERGWGPSLKIRNFKEDPPVRKKAASHAWLHAFIRQAERDGLPHLAALVMFMSQTAARVIEATELRWAEVDLLNRSAVLLKTKTSTNSRRFMIRWLQGSTRCRNAQIPRIASSATRAGTPSTSGSKRSALERKSPTSLATPAVATPSLTTPSP